MNAGQLIQSVSAGNIANAFTPDYQAARVELSQSASGGVNTSLSINEEPGYEIQNPDGTTSNSSNVDLLDEMVSLKMGGLMTQYNAAAFKIQSDTLGTIIDMVA